MPRVFLYYRATTPYFHPIVSAGLAAPAWRTLSTSHLRTEVPTPISGIGK
jgi:hypothetical protein